MKHVLPLAHEHEHAPAAVHYLSCPTSQGRIWQTWCMQSGHSPSSRLLTDPSVVVHLDPSRHYSYHQRLSARGGVGRG